MPTQRTSQRRAWPIREQRLCDGALGVLLALFVASVWPTLTAAPLHLDDQALIDAFAQAPVRSIWAYDHYGHLRPLKNLFFWGLAHRLDLLWLFRGLSLLAALLCTYCVRTLSLRLPARPLFALLSAALWLFNPATVTGVAWLAASNYLFALLGVLLYVLALERAEPLPSGPRARVLWWTGHLALLAAVLSQELAMLAPLWSSLRTASTQGDSPRSHTRVPRIAAGAAVVLCVPLALRLCQDAPVLAYRAGELPWTQLSAAAALHLGQNLRLWLLPKDSFGALLTPTPTSIGAVAASWLVALLCGWLGLVLGRRDALIREALCWVALFLVPVIDLVPLGNTPVATHYLILPGVGLAWLLVRLQTLLTQRWPRRVPALLAAATTALLVGWQPAFRQSVRAFCDEQRLYETTLRNYPDNVEARVNLIASHLRAQHWDEARQWLAQSLARAPDNQQLLQNQLSLLVQTGQLREALGWLDAHEELVRRVPDVALQRALLLLRVGRTGEAEPVLQRLSSMNAREARPQVRLQAGYQLANQWVQQGRLGDARALLRRLRAEFPESPELALALRLIDDVLRDRSSQRP